MKKEYTPGQLINNLVFICNEGPYIRPNGAKERRVRVVCQFCGKSFVTRVDKVSSGHTKSCGCSISQSRRIAVLTTHGLSGTHIFGVWKGMMDRCYNKKSISYPWYGACGVTICDEWRVSPTAFVDYVSKLPGYNKPGYTIDRMDTYGNYEPGNVKWSTWAEQNSNRKPKGTITQK